MGNKGSTVDHARNPPDMSFAGIPAFRNARVARSESLPLRHVTNSASEVTSSEW